jgi:hypothetical protein
VETAIFLEMAVVLLSSAAVKNGSPGFSSSERGTAGCPPRFTVCPADDSSFRGRQNENITSLKKRFHLQEISIASDADLPRQTLLLTAGGKRLQTDFSGRIGVSPVDPQ